MKKTLCMLVTSVILSIFISLPALAISLDFQPASQDVTLGDSVSVDLVISGLGDGEAVSLGAFDLNVLFDTTILSLDTTDADLDWLYDSVVLDPTGQLDLLGFDMNSMGTDLTGGTLNLYDISFDSVCDLNNHQASEFTLATLTFDTVGLGTSTLGIGTGPVLGDAWWYPLTTTVTDGSINVNPVPEPATMLLFGTGLAGLVTTLRRKREA